MKKLFFHFQILTFQHYNNLRTDRYTYMETFDINIIDLVLNYDSRRFKEVSI